MQDPLFTLAPEQALDLNTLFGPASQTEHSPANESQNNPQPEAIENSIAEPTKVQEIQDIVDKAENPKQDDPGSLLERIHKIEEEYNTNPIPIYGSMHKRLVTLAKKLVNKKLHHQANLVCNVLDGNKHA
jgi:hypothetical protein